MEKRNTGVEMVSILIGVLKVYFTVWLNLTAVKNYLVRKAIVGLLVNHIGFVRIRLL